MSRSFITRKIWLFALFAAVLLPFTVACDHAGSVPRDYDGAVPRTIYCPRGQYDMRYVHYTEAYSGFRNTIDYSTAVDGDDCVGSDKVTAEVASFLPTLKASIDKYNAVLDHYVAEMDSYLQSLRSIGDSRQRLLSLLKNECGESKQPKPNFDGTEVHYIDDAYQYMSTPWVGEPAAIADVIMKSYDEARDKQDPSPQTPLALSTSNGSKQVYGSTKHLDRYVVQKLYEDTWRSAYEGTVPEYPFYFQEAVVKMCGDPQGSRRNYESAPNG